MPDDGTEQSLGRIEQLLNTIVRNAQPVAEPDDVSSDEDELFDQLGRIEEVLEKIASGLADQTIVLEKLLAEMRTQ